MPRTKHPEATRQKILNVAIQLSREKGFEDVTVLDIIAGTGGLTRGAFYHHFKSKDDVLTAIFDSRWETMDPWVEIMARKDITGLEKLKRLIQVGLESNNDSEQNRAIVALALEALHSPRFFMEHHKGNLRQAQVMEKVLAEGMADGSIPQGNPRAISELLFLMFNFWMIPNIYPGSFEEVFARGDIIERILDMLGIPILDDRMADAFAETMGMSEALKASDISF